MKRLVGVLLLGLVSSPCLLADARDTTVFRTSMLPGNEVPPLSLPATSAAAKITVRVIRDLKGGITAATVAFDVDFTMPQSTTIVGLHIHNARAGVSGPVVISSGLSGSNSVTATTGHLTKVVNYSSGDTKALAFVSGLLSNPELYYVNMHSTVFPGGFIRGQLQADTVEFRPALSPGDEVPPVTGIDAQAAALITVSVHRDDSGEITSGTVTFAVDYRFAGGANIVGMHIHSGAAGVAGPVVISSGIASPITNSGRRGTLYRRVEITGSNSAGMAALKGLLADPSGYYVNIHTSTNPGGAIRGQLQKDVLNFYSHLTGDREAPPNQSVSTADVLTTATVTRDDTGNITGGSVTFNVNYDFDRAVTIVGMHIHNAGEGVSGPVEISSGLSGSNPVTSDTGTGSFTKQATIDSGNSAGIAALNGLFRAPRNYYVNIHTTVDPGGEIRAQMDYETYHFRPILSSGNEPGTVAPIATGNSWLTVTVGRDANGNITSGTVTFDVDCNLGGPAKVLAMHIHHGPAGVNGPVVIGSGISPIVTATGIGNITSSAAIDATNATGLGALAGLIANPADYYINLHTDSYPAGLIRSQLLPFVSFDPQLAGGGQWMSSLTITNPSSTSSADGLVEVFDRNGNPMAARIIDPVLPFVLPPGGSTTFSTYNGGGLADGFARIHSSAPVTSRVGYDFDGSSGVPEVSSVVGSYISIPVSLSTDGSVNTGIALLDLDTFPPAVIATLLDAAGMPVTGGSTPLQLSPGKRVVGLVNQLLPPGLSLGSQFNGTLTIQLNYGPFPGGLVSAVALQFNGANVTPIAIHVIQ